MKPSDFFAKYGIAGLKVSPGADIRDHAVSRVEVEFADDPDEGAPGYRIDFKVQDESAAGSQHHSTAGSLAASRAGSLEQAPEAHRVLRRIGAAPGCAIEWTADGDALGNEEKAAAIAALLRAIEDRVAKVHKEQSILNIQPVGKTFLLMDKTRFEVLADDGEGQLKIRLHRPEGTSEAGLNANDLLDGLYSGLITRA